MPPMNNFTQQLRELTTQPGLIAALDQTGGSTPSALMSYGIKKDAWSNEDEMLAPIVWLPTGRCWATAKA